MRMSIIAANSGSDPAKAAVKEFKAEAKRRGHKITGDPEVTTNGGIIRVEGQVEDTNPTER